MIPINELVEKDLSYKITGICFKVHNEHGRFLTEKQYCDALANELLNSGILFVREPSLDTSDRVIKIGRPDFVIEEKIILDAKAKKFVTKEDYEQMMKYLTLTKKRLGLIVNFHNTYLRPKRVLNYKLPHSKHWNGN